MMGLLMHSCISGLGAPLAGNLLLGWRAATRSTAFRVIAALMLVLGVSTPVLFSSFLFFGEGQLAHAELVSSNIFLWAFLFAFIVLPPISCHLSDRTAPVFNQLAPTSVERLVLGRLLGLSLAFSAVTAVLFVVGFSLEWLLFSHESSVFLRLAVQQTALGVVLISGTLLFSQVGGVLITSLGGVLWFLCGTQKAWSLEKIEPGAGQYLFSAAFFWLPDFSLFQVSTLVDRSSGLEPVGFGGLMLYALLIVCLNSSIASLVIRRTRSG